MIKSIGEIPGAAAQVFDSSLMTGRVCTCTCTHSGTLYTAGAAGPGPVCVRVWCADQLPLRTLQR